MMITNTDGADAPSAARQKLAAIIARRDEIAARAERLREAHERLAEAQAAEGPIAGELATLTAAETESMRAWAAAGDGAPPPKPDIERRESLEAALKSAQGTAARARGAAESIDRERAAALADAHRLETAIAEATIEVVADELAPLVDAYADANRALERRKVILGEGVAAMGRLADAFEIRTAPPVSRTLEWVSDLFRGVDLNINPMALMAQLGSRSPWIPLIAALKTDAAATVNVEA